MTDENTEAAPEAQPAGQEQAPQGNENAGTQGSASEGQAGLGADRYDFVLDKYRAEGRTESDSALEQAKGYNEIRKTLGGFTGAPESYEAALSEELTQAGVSLIADDPMLSQIPRILSAWTT